MTADQRAAMDRAKGPQPDPLRHFEIPAPRTKEQKRADEQRIVPYHARPVRA